MFKKILILILTTGFLTAEIPYSIVPLINFKQSEQGFQSVDFWKSMSFGREDTSEDFFVDRHALAVKNNFERFCESLGSDFSEYSIPHVIHLIWLGSTPSEKVSSCFESWKKHHPEWEVVIWDDEKVTQFNWTSEHSKLCFEQADTWAEKADILRLEVLFRYGGVYSDADVVCLNSFDALTKQDVGFFSSFELNYVGKHYGEPFFVGSAIMGAAKGSRVMKYCIENLQSKAEAPDVGIIKRTGPGLLSRACQSVIDEDSENVLILPCGYLYPLPWKKRDTSATGVLDFVSIETLAIHLWDGSWCTHKKKKK